MDSRFWYLFIVLAVFAGIWLLVRLADGHPYKKD